MKLLTTFCMLALASSAGAAIIADHVSVTYFDQIPAAAFAEMNSEFNFFYGHTSHGSQVVSGVRALSLENPALYPLPVFEEPWNDLGAEGDVSWAPETRDWLDANPDCNVVMWSWCGGVSDNSEEGINIYLTTMTQLENEYPGVVFIYMTGHLDGTGVDGNLYRGNNQIRAYCQANDKVLFDFADIESWDPDGNYYPDDDDGCNWCTDWCDNHPCTACDYCSHSQCFSCLLKGKGFWWMMLEVSSRVASEPATMGGVKTLFR